MSIVAGGIFALIAIASMVSIGLSIYRRVIEIKKLKREKTLLEQQDKQKVGKNNE